MKIKADLKDYVVAREMFGGNSKEQCYIVKKLRSNGIITPLCSDWSIITDKNKPDDCGWLISNECIE